MWLMNKASGLRCKKRSELYPCTSALVQTVDELRSCTQQISTAANRYQWYTQRLMTEAFQRSTRHPTYLFHIIRCQSWCYHPWLQIFRQECQHSSHRLRLQLAAFSSHQADTRIRHTCIELIHTFQQHISSILRCQMVTTSSSSVSCCSRGRAWCTKFCCCC